MTLDRLEKLACDFFNITKDDFVITGNRCTDAVAIARHCFRTLAVSEYNFTPKALTDFHGVSPSTVSISKGVILRDNVFDDEYTSFAEYVKVNDIDPVDIVVGENGIQRITNDAFDSRFYKSPDKLNIRTNLPYFPAFHTITKLGSPEPVGLTKWRQDKGHFADYLMTRAQIIGSYVHDCIDKMIKTDAEIAHEDIHKEFPDPKEAQRVKDCFLGFLNFMREEEPIILASEQMHCAKDFGFTLDNRMLLKSDGYKKTYTTDWKTSKTVNEDHKMQVETMRREMGDDKGMVIVLGNNTKRKYTTYVIKPIEQDYLFAKFDAIKKLAYVEMLKKGLIKPREDNMPKTFSLKSIKLQRKL